MTLDGNYALCCIKLAEVRDRDRAAEKACQREMWDR